MKVLIKGGEVITSTSGKISDVLLEGGKIKHIGEYIPASGVDEVINAGGYLVLPGGVDPHVHMHLPGPAGFSSDDFKSGSCAALHGGTSTLIDFVTPARGEALPDALGKRLKEAENSYADYSFHVSPVEWRNTTGAEMRECVREGITSFKVYMAYKSTIGLNDQDILKVMNIAAESGCIVTVHCESGDEIEALRKKYYSEGLATPWAHPLSRPASYEAAAVAKAIALARQAGCPLYIVHLSAKESLRHIREAQHRGQIVYAETCPQYLLLDESHYKNHFDQAAPYVISPPLRGEEDREALWEAVADGTISTIGTDHCPFMMGQKRAGIDDFRKIPNGAGGVEHRLALLYTYGVLEGRISINKMTDLFSTQPARIFGLHPRKGEIIEGADADIVLWNPGITDSISSKRHHQNCDVNIYEGLSIKGGADYVICGGRTVIKNGIMIDTDIRGNNIKRLPKKIETR